jgi:predicted nucleic acid-binding protein
MERRELLTSAVVQAAIYSVQQSQLDGKIAIAEEVYYLKSNILSIQEATTQYIASLNADIANQKADEAANPSNLAADKAAIATDKLDIKLATRDEKFAIAQQNSAIKAVNALAKPYNTALNNDIKAIKKGTIDSSTTPIPIVTTQYGNLQTALGKIDTKAYTKLQEVEAVFAYGNP